MNPPFQVDLSFHRIEVRWVRGRLEVCPVPPPTCEVIPDSTPEGIHPRAYEFWPNPGSTLIRAKRLHVYQDFQRADIEAVGEYEIRFGETSCKIFLVTFSKDARSLLRIYDGTVDDLQHRRLEGGGAGPDVR